VTPRTRPPLGEVATLSHIHTSTAVSAMRGASGVGLGTQTVILWGFPFFNRLSGIRKHNYC